MIFFGASLKENLAKHQLWLKSHGNQGQRFSAAGANFEKANLSGANLSKANLSGANLSEVNLSGANLIEATLFGAKLSGANLNAANLSGASLSGVELQGATLKDAILTEALLCEANLAGANFSNADLRKANLSLGIPEFLKAKNIQLLLIGSGIPFVSINQTNLKEANLSGANLSEANLDFANLSEANLSGANLTKAKLFAVDLSKANLSGANLFSADLFRVKALNTNFSFANLTHACIEEWIIDRDTTFDDVICDSIYLKHILRSFPDYILRRYCDRRPFNPKAKFAQGDFVKLISKGTTVSDLEKHGSEFLQEQILIEELHQIFEQLSEQYEQRYTNASVSDRETILRLEIGYQTQDDPAFRERLLEAINSPSELLTELLQNNSFVTISPQIFQSWLSV
jgi:uncharacterized protein YjbI with pentapeptide repeats